MIVSFSQRVHRRGIPISRSHGSIPRDRRRGTAAVELAVLLPFLFFVLCVSLDFCRIFYYSVTVANCARNGAVYGCEDEVRAQDTTGIEAAALADAMPNLDTELLTVASSTDADVSYLQVTVEYPFVAIVSYPGIPKNMNLSRTVRMEVVPSTPSFN